MGRSKGGYLGGSTIIRTWLHEPVSGVSEKTRVQRLENDAELQKIMQENDRRNAESKGDFGAQAIAKSKLKKWKHPKPRAPQILQDLLKKESNKNK